MKVLVTGGAGFLGSHVADALSEAGHQVTVFDLRRSPYLRDDQVMVTGNLLDQGMLENLVTGHQVVYHFAGIADIDECARKPVETVKYNILGTVMLLEACRKNDVKRFIFASSAYVFSNTGLFYRSSKQACELFISDYAEKYGLKYTSLRYGSLFGDRADERNSIYRILKQALETGKIVYSGTGNEVREFIHVRDAAASSVAILAPEFENQHIILTGAEKISYADLLAMINEILSNKIEIVMQPSLRKEHYNLTPYNFSPSLGRKLVNNPHIDMGQGLLQCIADLYQQIHSNSHETFNG